ncbi:hypothetical protein [Acidihalobacter yilgarnensis]|uniref:hypothetical protein n=1 Tax=Acidihalobacter yilgarnensis TaxID=2819280 RepID=UPI0012EA6C85|nr:hypothetical protein [Acidihalobacter yilgarnensis]
MNSKIPLVLDDSCGDNSFNHQRFARLETFRQRDLVAVDGRAVQLLRLDRLRALSNGG